MDEPHTRPNFLPRRLHGLNAVLDVYIGYDGREPEAYKACVQSLVRHASPVLHIHPLVQSELRDMRLYWREFAAGHDTGVVVDKIDGRPFSTEFAFTRFLVPHLQQSGWALFVDCDFLFLADIRELLDLLDDRYAVRVVKHDYRPPDKMKMDGQPQRQYNRKNWSSFCLWNCDHPMNRTLTPDIVNSQTGRWLHGFSWLRDDDIGGLPEAWNWLEGWSPLHIPPKAVHYTRGGPWFGRQCEYGELWTAEDAMSRVRFASDPPKRG